MLKSELLTLIQSVRSEFSGKLILVGSQVAHGVSFSPHDIVKTSLEVDALFSELTPEADKLKLKFGDKSAYQADHNVHLDILTPRAVSLPSGWENRVTPLFDFERQPVSNVFLADFHDVSVAKLLARREKDFVFLSAFLKSQDLDLNLLHERIRLMPPIHRFDILPRNLLQWGQHLSKAHDLTLARAVQSLALKLEGETLHHKRNVKTTSQQGPKL